MFKTSKEFADLKKLVRSSLEPEKLETFIDLIEHDEGYPLYQAVSATKMALSQNDEAEFNFPPLGRDGKSTVRRADFENWIAADLAHIEDALDEVLAKTNTQAGDIDKVFLTGGTSFVPAVQATVHGTLRCQPYRKRWRTAVDCPRPRLIGERNDIEQWTA